MGKGGLEDFNLERVGIPEIFLISVSEVLPLRTRGESLKEWGKEDSNPRRHMPLGP